MKQQPEVLGWGESGRRRFGVRGEFCRRRLNDETDWIFDHIMKHEPLIPRVGAS